MRLLIKLGIYYLVGYAIYEFFVGLTRGSDRGRSGNGGSRDLRRALSSDRGRMAMTGGGEGRSEQTEDESGTSIPHRVGRGVRKS